MSSVVAILQNFSELWRRTSLVQRVLILGILLACAGAAAVVVAWVSQPEYALLYSALSPEEAAKIVEKARDEGIPFKLTDGGTTVQVASDKVYTMRLKMARQGLPQGGHQGYSIIDKERFGSSPFLQKINHIRAIEGELAKSIETLDAVDSARVHIVPTESKLFAGSKNDATATVVVRVRGGVSLLAHNISAIQALVAGGVQGLKSNKVTVVDQAGDKLSDEGDSAIARGARGVLDNKVQAEQYLARKVEQMLAAALGPGRAKVQVSAEVDTKSVEQTTQTPVEGATVRESTKTKTPVGAGKGAVAGVKESTTETEYSTGQTVSRTITLPGAISNIKVACFVDLSKPVKEGEDSAAAGDIMKTEDVEAMIVNALGLKDKTDVKVTKTTFYKDPTLAAAQAEAGDEPMFTQAFILDIAKRSSLGVLVIGVLLALKMVRKGAKVPAGEPQTVIEGQVPKSDNLLTASVAAGANPDAMRKHITRALQENPEEVKRLFLSWASNEQENG